MCRSGAILHFATTQDLNSSAELNYDNEVKKYIEALSWVTIPRNTVNN